VEVVASQRPRQGYGQAARSATVAAIVLATGPIWAVAAVVGGALADGVGAEQYDAGNRASFVGALIVLVLVCPVGSIVGYTWSRSHDRSVVRSIAYAQLGAALCALPMFVLIAS
jgi:hypothetical protein